MQKEKFKTINEIFFFEIPKIKGSRFIGRVYPISSKIEAEKLLDSIRKEFYNVTHNCFAYKTGLGENNVYRFSDDGEPSGTAGKPILTALESFDLTNVLIVVTRIYGGTKLGTGGLIRAYAQSAKEVLENCNIIEVEITTKLKFVYKYDYTNLVMNIINKFEATIVQESYGDLAEMIIKLNSAYKDSFIEDIFERSNGQIEIFDNSV